EAQIAWELPFSCVGPRMHSCESPRPRESRGRTPDSQTVPAGRHGTLVLQGRANEPARTGPRLGIAIMRACLSSTRRRSHLVRNARSDRPAVISRSLPLALILLVACAVSFGAPDASGA